MLNPCIKKFWYRYLQAERLASKTLFFTLKFSVLNDLIEISFKYTVFFFFFFLQKFSDKLCLNQCFICV